MPAAARHSRLDLQRNLLDQDGQGMEATQSLTDGGEEERPVLQSGLPGVGVGTGLWGSAEGPHCRAHGTRGTGCCPLPHCLPWARSPAESRQILQICPLCPLPISLCHSRLKSLSYSQQPPHSGSPPVCLCLPPLPWSHLPGLVSPPSPCLPPRSLWRPAGSTWPGITVKFFPRVVLGVAESLLWLAEQTAWGRLEAHTWGQGLHGHTHRVHCPTSEGKPQAGHAGAGAGTAPPEEEAPQEAADGPG